MKVYAVTFIGVYPVGVCMVVVATDRDDARVQVKGALTRRGLFAENTDDKGQLRDCVEFQEIDTSKPGASIILDGNY